MKQKFEVAYFVAKNEFPFNNYKETVRKTIMVSKWETLNPINDIGYANFIDFIGLDLKNQLNKDLAKARFFSVLSDKSTSSLLTENKITYCLYFDPSPIDSDSVEVQCSFLYFKFHFLKIFHQMTSTQLSVIQLKKHLSSLEFYLQVIDWSDLLQMGHLLIEAVMTVKTKLRKQSPLLVFIWCITH